MRCEFGFARLWQWRGIYLVRPRAGDSAACLGFTLLGSWIWFHNRRLKLAFDGEEREKANGQELRESSVRFVGVAHCLAVLMREPLDVTAFFARARARDEPQVISVLLEFLFQCVCRGRGKFRYVHDQPHLCV